MPVFMSCANHTNRTENTVDTTQVPDIYRHLYTELAVKLNHLDRALDAGWDGQLSDAKFGVELLVANANRGEVLLTDRVFHATPLTLDTFNVQLREMPDIIIQDLQPDYLTILTGQNRRDL